jgi:hypothetical protein
MKLETNLKDAWEDGIFAFLSLTFFLDLLDVCCELIEQVVDDSRLEDFDLVDVCVLFGFRKYLHIEDQQTRVSNLEMNVYSCYLRLGSSSTTFLTAFITSSFETGPTLTYETGIFEFLRNCSSASSDPRR